MLIGLRARLAGMAVLAIARTLFAGPALAQENGDITAAARSVVRVALIENVGDEQYLLGHASGVAVAPNLIVTNAHVVAPLEMTENIGITIVPAEGARRYVGRLIAIDPRVDLALIQLESGAVPVATIYTGPLDENARVAAIGYPGSVDLAENLTARDRVTPMDAVRTFGQLSGGRSRRDVATLLHTAAMAQGNSGGPLVDGCGRIVGVNSFGSLTSGSDAEFGFAIAARELVPFLRANDVRPRTIGLACEPMAERDRREALRRASEDDAADARERSSERTEREAIERREQMRQTIAEERETGMAVAALLLVLGALAGGGGLVLFAYRASIRHGMYLASAAWGVGGVLMIAAVTVFVTRPTMGDLAERVGDDDGAVASADTAGYDPVGANQCELDGELSRITVSQPEPVRFEWSEGGCRDGDTQFTKAEDGVWQRPFVAGDEPVVRIESFDADRGSYTIQRYQMSAALLVEARQIRARYREGSCETGAGGAIGQLHREIAELLPRAPNEHLAYQCQKGEAE